MDDDPTREAEDQQGEPGAEGGAGGDQDVLPGAPSEDDDSAAGDTDQHSSADA